MCHSLASFEAERENAGDGPIQWGQYLLGTTKEKNQAIAIANALRKQLGIPTEVDLGFLAHLWEAFRGGYPPRPE